jgi:hypothetical protein
MKNLVLSALVAAMATQAACIIESDDTGANRIAVTWNYKVNGVTRAGCPAGANGVDLLIKNQTTLREDVYQYNCSDPVLIEYVDDGTYQIWVELMSGGQTYAQSLSLIDDVFGVDKDITVDIHEDRGFFFTQWSLKGRTTQAPLTCNQVPDLQFISLLATPVGTAQRIDSQSQCSLGASPSLALAAGLYTLSLDAVNSRNQALGTAGIATNQAIQNRNQVTNLGTVVIPIDGQ